MSESPSFVKNIYNGISNYKQKHWLILLCIGPTLDSFLFYIQTQISFRRSHLISENNKIQYLNNYYILFGVSILQVSINLLFNNWFKKFIVQDLKQYYQQFYLKSLLLKANPYWLSNQDIDEIYNSFRDGSETVVDMLIFCVDSLKGIINILLSFTLVWKELGLKNMSSLVMIVGLVYCQYLNEERNKENHNNLRKKNKKYRIQNNSLSQNLFINYLNGHGQQIVKYILENELFIFKSRDKVRFQYLAFRDILFMVEKCLRLANMVYLSSSFNCAELFTFEMIFSRIKYNIGYPINLYKDLCEKTTDWFELQEKLETIILDDNLNHHKLIMKDFDINYIIPNHIVPRCLEYRIIGPSGTGKSTWIMSSLCDMKRKYQESWFYLDQQMNIPQNKYLSIFEYFQIYFLNKEMSNLKENIIIYSKLLGLEKIINIDKIDKPFQNPSGGEIKRICILRKFLPILLKDICPKVIFADEISAGLDDINFQRVRDLIEDIKSKYGIVFVVVEHRNYQSKTQIINLKVEITAEIDPHFDFDKTEKEESYYLDKLFSSFNNKTIEDEDEPEITYPPRVSIQSFKVIRPQTNNCSLM